MNDEKLEKNKKLEEILNRAAEILARLIVSAIDAALKDKWLKNGTEKEKT